MSKGFLTIAQNGQHDYLKMAYVLSMSLKMSQTKYDKLSVIVNEGEKIPSKYLDFFDKVISVDNPNDGWKIQNKWRFYELTPYDETIILDADMLFFYDISTWWECLKNSKLEFTTSVRNYRGEVATSDYYRKTFTMNNLPNLYTALFYFKKNKENEEYFKLVEIIFKNWKDFFKKFLKSPPKFLSGDVAYSLAAKILFPRNWNNFLTFTHMRSRLQDEDIVTDWHKELPSFFSRRDNILNLKISNFNQIYPFHYIKKDFLNEEVVQLYEETLCLL